MPDDTPTPSPTAEVAASMIAKYGRKQAHDWACHYAMQHDAGSEGRRWWDDVIAAIDAAKDDR